MAEATREHTSRVLLTGATGFVGAHVYPTLVDAGMAVRCGTRDPRRAEQRLGARDFVPFDVDDPASILSAMRGCDSALYLVHSMAEHADYEHAEARGAENFAHAAEVAGLSRIVYLGGMKPAGKPSRHLASRLRTGEILRAGRVPVIELRATMVIGPGSESWRIVRDLAARLPLMVLPRWLDSRSQPIDISDVAVAILHALRADGMPPGAYALPGPETLSAREILARTAGLMGLYPHMIGVPVVTPQLSSYWIALVTRADTKIARQLVEGLRGDLVAPDEGFWRLLPGHQRMSFDEAARRALEAEQGELPLSTLATEWLLHRLTRPTRRDGRKPDAVP